MKNKTRLVLFYICFFLCTLFSLGAAMNEGITRWVTGIPFFVLFFVINKAFKQSKKFYHASIIIIISTIVFNITLSQNPLMYPILFDGHLVIKEDGYIHQYSDNSAGFYSEIDTGISCTGCGQIQHHKVFKGDKIPVEGIVYNYPDFSFKRSYKTKFGNITPAENIETSHKPCPLLKLGNLMYYPALPILISSIWN